MKSDAAYCDLCANLQKAGRVEFYARIFGDSPLLPLLFEKEIQVKSMAEEVASGRNASQLA